MGSYKVRWSKCIVVVVVVVYDVMLNGKSLKRRRTNPSTPGTVNVVSDGRSTIAQYKVYVRLLLLSMYYIYYYTIYRIVLYCYSTEL